MEMQKENFNSSNKSSAAHITQMLQPSLKDKLEQHRAND